MQILRHCTRPAEADCICTRSPARFYKHEHLGSIAWHHWIHPGNMTSTPGYSYGLALQKNRHPAKIIWGLVSVRTPFSGAGDLPTHTLYLGFTKIWHWTKIMVQVINLRSDPLWNGDVPTGEKVRASFLQWVLFLAVSYPRITDYLKLPTLPPWCWVHHTLVARKCP